MRNHNPRDATPNVVRTYELAARICDQRGVEVSTWLTGLRVGLALALWRPTAATTLMLQYKIHAINNSTLTLEEMASFEQDCIEAIFNCTMREISTQLEVN